jgi:hypothetical protein
MLCSSVGNVILGATMKPENNQVDYEKSKGHVELWTKNKEDRNSKPT